MFKPTIEDHGKFISHDMPCAICLRSGAQYYIGVFHPCVTCDEKGWRLIQLTERPWWAFWKCNPKVRSPLWLKLKRKRKPKISRPFARR